MKQEVLLSTLLAMRAQLDMLIEALESRDGPCQHPESGRVSLATMGHPNDWACKLCGHEQRG